MADIRNCLVGIIEIDPSSPLADLRPSPPRHDRRREADGPRHDTPLDGTWHRPIEACLSTGDDRRGTLDVIRADLDRLDDDLALQWRAIRRQYMTHK